MLNKLEVGDYIIREIDGVNYNAVILSKSISQDTVDICYLDDNKTEINVPCDELILPKKEVENAADDLSANQERTVDDLNPKLSLLEESVGEDESQFEVERINMKYDCLQKSNYLQYSKDDSQKAEKMICKIRKGWFSCSDLTVKTLSYQEVDLYPLAARCAICNKFTILRCRRCNLVFYCSRECQKNHWYSTHSKECKSRQFIRFDKIISKQNRKDFYPHRYIHIQEGYQQLQPTFFTPDRVHTTNNSFDKNLSNESHPIAPHPMSISNHNDTNNDNNNDIFYGPSNAPYKKENKTTEYVQSASVLYPEPTQNDIETLMEMLGYTSKQDREDVKTALTCFSDINSAAEWLLNGKATPLPTPSTAYTGTVGTYPATSGTGTGTGTGAMNSTITDNYGIDIGNGTTTNRSRPGSARYSPFGSTYPASASVSHSTNTPSGWYAAPSERLPSTASTSNLYSIPHSPTPTGTETRAGDDGEDKLSPSWMEYNVTLYESETELFSRRVLIRVQQASNESFSMRITIAPLSPIPDHPGGSGGQKYGLSSTSQMAWPLHELTLDSSEVLSMIRVTMRRRADLEGPQSERRRAEAFIALIKEVRRDDGQCVRLRYRITRVHGDILCESAEEMQLYDPHNVKGSQHRRAAQVYCASCAPPTYEGTSMSADRDACDVRVDVGGGVGVGGVRMQSMNNNAEEPSPHETYDAVDPELMEKYELSASLLTEMLEDVDSDRVLEAIKMFHGDADRAAEWLMSSNIMPSAPLPPPPPPRRNSRQTHPPTSTSPVTVMNHDHFDETFSPVVPNNDFL